MLPSMYSLFSQAFVKRQAEFTQSYLQQDDNREKFKTTLTEMYNYPRCM